MSGKSPAKFSKTLGIDVGGTNTDIVIFDSSTGKFSHVKSMSTRDFVKNPSVIGELAHKYCADAIGLGIAAWFSKGEIIHSPHLPVEELRFDFSLPLFMDNDANCFAIYSHSIFPFDNILAVTIGTGIGCGLIINGKLYRGRGLAGEIGHWVVGREGVECKCGGLDHLECYFSGWGIRRIYGVDAKTLAKTQDLHKIPEFDILCMALSNAVKILDPDAVVIGGRIGGELREDLLKARIMVNLERGFNPIIKVLKDPLAAAKGASLLPFKG